VKERGMRLPSVATMDRDKSGDPPFLASLRQGGVAETRSESEGRCIRRCEAQARSRPKSERKVCPVPQPRRPWEIRPRRLSFFTRFVVRSRVGAAANRRLGGRAPIYRRIPAAKERGMRLPSVATMDHDKSGDPPFLASLRQGGVAETRSESEGRCIRRCEAQTRLRPKSERKVCPVPQPRRPGNRAMSFGVHTFRGQVPRGSRG
jgi:hypothetical protein